MRSPEILKTRSSRLKTSLLASSLAIALSASACGLFDNPSQLSEKEKSAIEHAGTAGGLKVSPGYWDENQDGVFTDIDFGGCSVSGLADVKTNDDGSITGVKDFWFRKDEVTYTFKNLHQLQEVLGQEPCQTLAGNNHQSQ